MPRLTRSTPKYRRHRASGQAIVTLNGRDIYVGPHGTETSKREYDRVIAEWLANGRRLHEPADTNASDLAIVELIDAYDRHAESYYVKNGTPTSELGNIRQAMIPLQRLYGRRSGADFGPAALKAVRRLMVDSGWSRGHVNAQIGRIRRMVKWAVENELIPPNVYHGVQAVSGLKRGRSAARETDPVRPVDDEFVNAIKKHVSPQVWAMVELQRLTGMRSSEVCMLRGADIDVTGKLWIYRPASHKTEHFGRERTVELGPKAQKIIGEFWKSDVNAFLFSPADWEAVHRAERSRRRKTPLSRGNRPGTNRKRQPKRRP